MAGASFISLIARKFQVVHGHVAAVLLMTFVGCNIMSGNEKIMVDASEGQWPAWCFTLDTQQPNCGPQSWPELSAAVGVTQTHHFLLGDCTPAALMSSPVQVSADNVRVDVSLRQLSSSVGTPWPLPLRAINAMLSVQSGRRFAAFDPFLSSPSDAPSSRGGARFTLMDPRTGEQLQFTHARVVAPPEHRVGGSSSAAEIQLVHEAAASAPAGADVDLPSRFFLRQLSLPSAILSVRPKLVVSVRLLDSASGTPSASFEVLLRALELAFSSGGSATTTEAFIDENRTAKFDGGFLTAPQLALTKPLQLHSLLPNTSPDYFEYVGAHLMPPCTANVRFLVMRDALLVSPSQIERLHAVLAHDGDESQGGVREPMSRAESEQVRVSMFKSAVAPVDVQQRIVAEGAAQRRIVAGGGVLVGSQRGDGFAAVLPFMASWLQYVALQPGKVLGGGDGRWAVDFDERVPASRWVASGALVVSLPIFFVMSIAAVTMAYSRGYFRRLSVWLGSLCSPSSSRRGREEHGPDPLGGRGRAAAYEDHRPMSPTQVPRDGDDDEYEDDDEQDE